MVYTAAPGERNQLSAEPASDLSLIIRDAGAAITPGNGCVAIAGGVQCTAGSFGAPWLVASLGDGDDVSTANGDIDGGVGDDQLSGSGYLTGGPGDDVLTATGQATVLIDADGSQPGHDVYRGYGGTFLSYRDRPGPVRVDLRPGHRSEDQIIGLSNVTGGDGDDIIYGDDNADTIDGGPGADRIYGLGGNDQLSGGGDIVDGGEGDDYLEGSSSTGLLRCGAGHDEVNPRQDRIEDCESLGAQDGSQGELHSTLASVYGSILDLYTCDDCSEDITTRFVLHWGRHVIATATRGIDAGLRLNLLGRRELRRHHKLTVRFAQRDGCSFVLTLKR